MWFDYGINNTKSIVNRNPVTIHNNPYSKISFKQGPVQDTFQNNSVERIFNETEIRKLIAQNPEITNILSENKIPVRLNIKELQEMKDNHCKDTQNIAVAIYKHLPKVLIQDINLADLKDGAFLHDFGKVLIPGEILNKNGKLTDAEHKIMDLHTELGYQLLKNTTVNENVRELVRLHHGNYEKTPNGTNFIQNVSLQIINLADKYSALTEKRCYKNAFSSDKALSIIAQDVQEGKVHPMLYKALLDAVRNNELPRK